MADTQPTLNIAAAIIAIGMVAILGFVVWAMVYLAIPQANAQLFSTALGIVGTQVGLIVGFYFGSSANNKKLADTNATQAQTIAQAQNALTPDAKTVTIEPGQTAQVNAKDTT